MAVREGKLALVLSGGGMPGWMYEIGCLKALDEFFDDGFTVNDVDIYVGTSAGAAVAALMVNQIPPKDIFDAICENKDHPYNFKSSDIYGFGYQETFFLIKKFIKSLFPMIRYVFKNRKQINIIDIYHMLEEHLPSG